MTGIALESPDPRSDHAELQSKGARKKPEVLEEIRGARQAFKDKFRPWLESNETPINPYRVFGDLAKVLDPKSSFLTADSGNTREGPAFAVQELTEERFVTLQG